MLKLAPTSGPRGIELHIPLSGTKHDDSVRYRETVVPEATVAGNPDLACTGERSISREIRLRNGMSNSLRNAYYTAGGIGAISIRTMQHAELRDKMFVLCPVYSSKPCDSSRTR